MPLSAGKQQQQQQQLSQSLGQTGQSVQGHEELWRLKETAPALLVRQQQELGQQGQGQQVQCQGEGREDLWRGARDTQSQVTLCRQQQMLIYELRRQLEQSRRALIEAQAGELKLAAEQPHPPGATTTQTPAGDFPTSPAGSHASADTQPTLQLSVGGACSSRSLDYADVVATATCAPGLSFSLHDPHLTHSSAANSLQQQPQLTERKTAGDDSLSRNRRLISLEHDVQLSLQPTQQTLVHFFL